MSDLWLAGIATAKPVLSEATAPLPAEWRRDAGQMGGE